MRELKFKIYDKNDTNCLIGPFVWNKLPQFLFPENFTVLQFTGLKDKNDKEIYEGDIIKGEDEYAIRGDKVEKQGEVRWHHSYFAVGNVKLFTLKDDTLEIIGNIFQNNA